MPWLTKNRERFFKWILEKLSPFINASRASTNNQISKPPIAIPTNSSFETKLPETKPVIDFFLKKEAVIEDESEGFLSFPIRVDSTGKSLTAYTAEVSAIIDYSGTPIDSDPVFVGSKWYQDNNEVKAFNIEVGNFKKFIEEQHAGFSQESGEPFLLNEKINYVGVRSQGGNKYLQYDGHSGYDFKYGKGTLVVAPADGTLHKALDDRSINGGINGNNTKWYKEKFGKENPTAWDGWHSFYIKHPIGLSTWFLHCEKLEDGIEEEIELDYTKSVSVKRGDPIAYIGTYGFNFDNYHLHFEVRDKNGKIVDPYANKLWRDS